MPSRTESDASSTNKDVPLGGENWKKRRLQSSDIGLPKDFDHVAHVAPRTVRTINWQDPDLVEFLNQADVTPTQLEKPHILEAVANFIQTHGMERVRAEVQFSRQATLEKPSTPAPITTPATPDNNDTTSTSNPVIKPSTSDQADGGSVSSNSSTSSSSISNLGVTPPAPPSPATQSAALGLPRRLAMWLQPKRKRVTPIEPTLLEVNNEKQKSTKKVKKIKNKSNDEDNKNSESNQPEPILSKAFAFKRIFNRKKTKSQTNLQQDMTIELKQNDDHSSSETIPKSFETPIEVTSLQISNYIVEQRDNTLTEEVEEISGPELRSFKKLVRQSRLSSSPERAVENEEYQVPQNNTKIEQFPSNIILSKAISSTDSSSSSDSESHQEKRKRGDRYKTAQSIRIEPNSSTNSSDEEQKSINKERKNRRINERYFTAEGSSIEENMNKSDSNSSSENNIEHTYEDVVIPSSPKIKKKECIDINENMENKPKLDEDYISVPDAAAAVYSNEEVWNNQWYENQEAEMRYKCELTEVKQMKTSWASVMAELKKKHNSIEKENETDADGNMKHDDDLSVYSEIKLIDTTLENSLKINDDCESSSSDETFVTLNSDKAISNIHSIDSEYKTIISIPDAPKVIPRILKENEYENIITLPQPQIISKSDDSSSDTDTENRKSPSETSSSGPPSADCQSSADSDITSESSSSSADEKKIKTVTYRKHTPRVTRNLRNEKTKSYPQSNKFYYPESKPVTTSSLIVKPISLSESDAEQENRSFENLHTIDLISGPRKPRQLQRGARTKSSSQSIDEAVLLHANVPFTPAGPQHVQLREKLSANRHQEQTISTQQKRISVERNPSYHRAMQEAEETQHAIIIRRHAKASRTVSDSSRKPVTPKPILKSTVRHSLDFPIPTHRVTEL